MMKIAGIVVEYNPLHNGHIYHLNRIKTVTGCNYIVAVMSGNFVQRGEPAFVNKWARTKMALLAGVDLVLELPAIYSTSSAEGFAFGSVSTLNSLGVIDSLLFGSEVGDIKKLELVSEILYKEPEEFKFLLKKFLKEGLSFPSSRENALMEYLKNNINETLDINEIMANSNNILAIEYMKALYNLKSKIKPYTVKRIGNKYIDTNITGFISSATSIRNNFNDIKVLDTIPSFTKQIIDEEIKAERGPLYLEDFSNIILYKLRKMELFEISELMDVNEGLQYKIKKGAEESSNINELISHIVNKRYPRTRIQRILINVLLENSKEMKNKIKSPVEYIRVLGFNENGKKIIKMIKEECTLPIITNPSRNDIITLKHDIFATDTYVLGYKSAKWRVAKQDLKTPPIYVNYPYL